MSDPATTATTAAPNPFDEPYGAGKSEYERYLRTSELLALQKPPAARTHPDELFFQTVHQAEELWMKCMLHDLGQALVALAADAHAEARRALDRVADAGRLLEAQLRLFERMVPAAYLAIRRGLGHGSGMDSPGFVRLNEVAPAVWAGFEAALGRAGVELLALYAEPSAHAGLLAVAEGLADVDAQLQRFKREHIMVCRRIIGLGTASLRGNPMELLERSAQLTWFPLLWAVRDRLFVDFKAGPPLR
jgi:tryptophan 2,3-dioxygenase